MDVKHNFKYNPVGSFGLGNPFTIAFVYPARDKPFIVKGGSKDVEKFFTTYKEPYIVHRTYWFHKKSRSNIDVVNTIFPILVLDRSFYTDTWFKLKIDKKKKWCLWLKTVDGKGKLIVAMKRFPRRWIRQLDEYITPGDTPKGHLHQFPKETQQYRLVRL